MKIFFDWVNVRQIEIFCLLYFYWYLSLDIYKLFKYLNHYFANKISKEKSDSFSHIHNGRKRTLVAVLRKEN